MNDESFYNIVQEVKEHVEEAYAAEILGIDFIFRPLLRYEFIKIVQMDLKVAATEEEICNTCVIYPQYDFSSGPAGVAKTLSDLIKEVSGAQRGQSLKLLEDYRNELDNYDNVADLLIHQAFPEYTYEQISSWPIKKTMKFLAKAEFILYDLKGYDIPLLKTDIEEEREEPENDSDQEAKETPPKKDPEEEDILKMLEQKTGKKASTENELGMYPEMSWFKHEDDLTGEK